MKATTWASVSISAALLLATPDCTPGVVVDLCEEICNCEGCNTKEQESCEVLVESSIDIAENYECGEDADRYYECLFDKGDCEDSGGNDVFTDCDINGNGNCSCDDEQDDLRDCVDDGSKDDLIDFD